MPPIISIRDLTKVYRNGFQALKGVDLDVQEGEILALLGPNGAGKTTMISIVCGIANPSGGTVTVGGFDVVKNFRQTRSLIGLVPQELTTDQFETVWNTVSFSRGLFGKKPDAGHIERVLRDLSLWDKRNNTLRELSGGMKRRVLIAKALAHEPRILFLDEPTAGVDVTLRKEMWQVVDKLRAQGVTVILTTHYIEEAEAIADRVGVINGGRLLLVEEKAALMRKLGKKQVLFDLPAPMEALPRRLEGDERLSLDPSKRRLIFDVDPEREQDAVFGLMALLHAEGVKFDHMSTRQSSLEDIFVSLVGEKA